MENKQEPLLYVTDLTDNSVWEILSIDTKETNRLGWMNGKCIHIGNDSNNYIGADIGIDAETVFAGKKYDVSKRSPLLVELSKP